MNPRHLGVATVGASETTLGAATPGGPTKPAVRSLSILALDTNTQTVFLGEAGMNTTTMAGVISKLEPGSEYTVGGSPGFGPVAWQNLYAIAGGANQKLLITGVE